jgi:hypothetical protein
MPARSTADPKFNFFCCNTRAHRWVDTHAAINHGEHNKDTLPEDVPPNGFGSHFQVLDVTVSQPPACWPWVTRPESLNLRTRKRQPWRQGLSHAARSAANEIALTSRVPHHHGSARRIKNHCGGNSTGGSNSSPSAKSLRKTDDQKIGRTARSGDFSRLSPKLSPSRTLLRDVIWYFRLDPSERVRNRHGGGHVLIANVQCAWPALRESVPVSPDILLRLPRKNRHERRTCV